MDLNQVTVHVSEMDASVAFYSLLGLRLIVKTETYARFECPDGGSTFSLHHSKNIGVGERPWIYFEVPDPDAKVKDLTEKGIPFDELPADQPWLWREARLHDPDGNTIIIYHAGSNRKDPPWKIR